jgi:hypothetical protein
MNQKKYIITIIVTVVATSLVTSLFFLKKIKPTVITQSNENSVFFPQSTDNNTTTAQAPVGSAFLFGQINNVNTNNGKVIINLGLVENEKAPADQLQAALADGMCTLDQIENVMCLNDPFYMYKMGKTISLPLDNGADIEVYVREPKGGMLPDKNGNIYIQKITVQKFLEENNSKTIDSGTYYTVVTKGGVIKGLKEQYTP